MLLVSCYELGHQPLGIAWPRAFLEQAGYTPEVLDLAVDAFDEAAVRRARFVGVAVPMHTALRLGVRAVERIRRLNPDCFVCFYGLYALLNADYLLAHVADAVIGGEFEGPLVALVERLTRDGIPGVAGATEPPAAALGRLAIPCPTAAGSRICGATCISRAATAPARRPDMSRRAAGASIIACIVPSRPCTADGFSPCRGMWCSRTFGAWWRKAPAISPSATRTS